jgi:hypothetical protein
MGTNQMDLATRIPAARAGFAQGKQEATRVTFLLTIARRRPALHRHL